jgi:hypothetical protein
MVHSVNVINVEEDALGPPENAGIVLNSLALRWGVDYTEHLLEVVEEELEYVRALRLLTIGIPAGASHSEVQNLVLLLQGGQKRVL